MTFKQGSIVLLELDPASGREMKGKRPALVVSPFEFQKNLGLHVVCPISQGLGSTSSRDTGYLITLMGAGTDTTGNIHVHQMAAVDLRERNARFVEDVPKHVLNEVLQALAGLFESGPT